MFRTAKSAWILSAMALWLVSRPALAQEDGYTQVIEDALVEFDSGNYAEARVLFEQAHAVRPSARTLRGMGLASYELKEYLRAERELNASLVDLRAPLSAAQRQEALVLLLRLERYIGTLIVRTQPESASVMLDGAQIPHKLRIELGRHELAVQSPGYRPLTRTVSVDGGKTLILELGLTAIDLGARRVSGPDRIGTSSQTGAQPVATASGSVFGKWWFWSALGVVAIGGVATAVALTAKSHSEPIVPGNTGATVQVLSWRH